MKVFISHTTADTELVRRVARSLRRAGIEAWDGTEIFPGDNWAAKIAQALEESEAMVVLLTPDTVRSDEVKRDISYALGEERFRGRLVSVLAASPGQVSKEDVPWVLYRLPMIRLPEYERDEDGIAKIAEILKSPVEPLPLNGASRS